MGWPLGVDMSNAAFSAQNAANAYAYAYPSRDQERAILLTGIEIKLAACRLRRKAAILAAARACR